MKTHSLTADSGSDAKGQSASEIVFALGDGAIAQTFAAILQCPLVARKSDDQGWDWPYVRGMRAATVVYVVGQNASASQVIRLHAQCWDLPAASQIRSLVVYLSPGLASELTNRDVFGRIGNFNESFKEWSEHIALAVRFAPLADCLQVIANLVFCPVETWRRRAANASCLSPLIDAIRARDARLLSEILPRAKSIDWDSVCSHHPEFGSAHAYANRVDRWLRGVTPSVTPKWEEGEKLFSSLIRAKS